MRRDKYPRANLYRQYQQPRGWTGGRLWWLPWPPKSISVGDVVLAVMAVLTLIAIVAGGNL